MKKDPLVPTPEKFASDEVVDGMVTNSWRLQVERAVEPREDSMGVATGKSAETCPRF